MFATLHFNIDWLASLVVTIGGVWGVVWGGITLWHKKQAKLLNDRFDEQVKPLFDDILSRLGDQDQVLEKVCHEVEFNNGSSVKDGVTRVENQVREIHVTQMDVKSAAEATSRQVAKIDRDLTRHLGFHDGAAAAAH